MDASIHEKIGVLTSKADAAHTRVDKLESEIRDTLKEVKAELKDLNSYMHKQKGWIAAFVLLTSAGGAGILKLLQMVGK